MYSNLPPWDPNYGLYAAQQQQQAQQQAQQMQQQQQLSPQLDVSGAASMYSGGKDLYSLINPGSVPDTPVPISGTPVEGMGIPGYLGEGLGYAGAAYNLYNAFDGKSMSNPTNLGGGVGAGLGAIGGGVAGSLFGMPGVGAGIGSTAGYHIGRDVGTAFDPNKDLSTQDKILYGASIVGVPLVAADIISGAFGSGKGKDQRRRDAWRKDLKAKGFLDDNYSFTDSEGNSFAYGSEKLRATPKNQGGQAIKNQTPGNMSYNINWDSVNNSNDQQQILGAIDPLMFILTGGEKRWQDAVGNAFNDAMQSGDPAKRVAAMYQKANGLGLTWGEQKEMIRQANEAGKIDDSTRDAWYAATDRVYGVQNPNAPATDSNGWKPSGNVANAAKDAANAFFGGSTSNGWTPTGEVANAAKDEIRRLFGVQNLTPQQGGIIGGGNK
jgi:hypothetical protein